MEIALTSYHFLTYRIALHDNLTLPDLFYKDETEVISSTGVQYLAAPTGGAGQQPVLQPSRHSVEPMTEKQVSVSFDIWS